MKYGNNGKIVFEIIGLRCKMYSLKVQLEQIRKEAKKFKNTVMEFDITFDDYYNNLFEEFRTMEIIRSFKDLVCKIVLQN